MATRRKTQATKTTKPRAPKKTAAKTNGQAESWDLGDEKEGAVPGAGRLFAGIAPKSAKGAKGQPKGILVVKQLAGEEEVHDALTGVVARSHPWRKFYGAAYNPDEAGPPDCSSIDGHTGQPKSEEALAQLKNLPGYTGRCDGCPYAVTRGLPRRCASGRAVYFLRQEKGDTFEESPYLVWVSRTGDRGGDDTYTAALGGKEAARHLVTLYAVIGVNEKVGNTYPRLAWKVAGPNPMKSPQPIKDARASIDAAGTFLLPAGPTVTEIPEHAGGDESF